MKTQLSRIPVLVLAFVPLLNGCTQPPQSASNYVSRAEATLPPPPPQAPASTAVPVEAEPAPVAAEVAQPANLNLSPALAEIAKLAQAGVDESVMLAYITNSTKIFNAGADEIVYLNDLGVSGTIITTMMQHDQGVKQYWANQASQQPAAPQVEQEATASAPTYVEPPQTAPAEALPQQPTTIVNNNYFDSTLSPYGTWVEVEGYGRCWQPTVVVVNREWRPYSDRGRWVYSDAGWYWLSEYSWGATTFHYGRWFTHPRLGWCWWPDTVWAPSWVTWRSGGEYCGWAPLPPRASYHSGVGFTYYGRSVGVGFDFGLSVGWFTYVPWGRFCDPRPNRYCAPRNRVTEIHNNTTIINNYGSGNNNTVVNNGVPAARVRELSHKEIKPVRIREDDVNEPLRRGRRGEQLAADGSTLTVHRPQLESHRRGENRNRADAPANTPVTSPVANLTSPSASPVNTTTPRTGENQSLRRDRDETERNLRVKDGRTPTRVNAPDASPKAPSSATVSTPSANTPSTQQPTSAPTVNRKKIEEARRSEVQREQARTESPVIVPDSTRKSPLRNPQAQAPATVTTPPPNPTRQSPVVISQPQQTSPANTTRVWTQPQRQESARSESPRQETSRREERLINRNPQISYSAPTPTPSAPAPVFVPQQQQRSSPSPVNNAPRAPSVESRSAPAPQSAPAPSVSSRSESRSESRRSDSNRSVSGNSDSGRNKKDR